MDTLEDMAKFEKRYGEDTVSALVLSVARELVFNQMHNADSYQFNVFKCYQWLVSILGKLPKQEIVRAYEKIYTVEKSFGAEKQH